LILIKSAKLTRDAAAVVAAKHFFAATFGAPAAQPGPHQKTTITPADAEAILRKLGRWR
jgi:hypothetical protein